MGSGLPGPSAVCLVTDMAQTHEERGPQVLAGLPRCPFERTKSLHLMRQSAQSKTAAMKIN